MYTIMLSSLIVIFDYAWRDSVLLLPAKRPGSFYQFYGILITFFLIIIMMSKNNQGLI